MMREEGLVLALDGDYAIVSGWRKKGCGSCHAQSTCAALSGGLGNREVQIRAHNTCHAEVGDRVMLEISERQFLNASFWVYIFPMLALLLVGGGATHLLEGMALEPGRADLLGALTGLAAMAGSFLLIRTLSERFAQGQSQMPKVTEVLFTPFTCSVPGS